MELPHALSVEGAYHVGRLLGSVRGLRHALAGGAVLPELVSDLPNAMLQLDEALGASDFRLALAFLWDVLLEARRLQPRTDVLALWARSGCRHACVLEMMADSELELPAEPASWFMVRSRRCYDILEHRLVTADINARDQRQATPLFYATNGVLFKFLLERGANALLLWEARTLSHPRTLRLALDLCPGFVLDVKRMLTDPEHATAVREEYVALIHSRSVEIPRNLIDSLQETSTCHALLSYGYLSKVPVRLNLGLIRWHPRTHRFFWSPLLQQRILLVLMVLKRKSPQLPRDIRILLLDMIMN